MKKLILVLSALALTFAAAAQTATSLFWKSDSLQVSEIVSEAADLYDAVGHGGPAIENSHMILRMLFNDSGAIDVYSKSGRGMELRRYLWHPTHEQQEIEGAGADAYDEDGTVGCGGFALWDGEKEVKLIATKGRTARVGDTNKGSYAEMTAYGVEYMGDMVDIMVRIDVNMKKRVASVSAKELSGKKVRFMTGLNYHEGQKVVAENEYVTVWGVHPVEGQAFPVGAALIFSEKEFPTVEKAEGIVRVISETTSEVKTKIAAASTKEAELNSAKRFEEYVVD